MTAAVDPAPPVTDRAERRAGRVRTPTVIQMEAVECGAACLGIVLAHYGRVVPLEELRITCGVSRDGASAKNIVDAAARYGLSGRGFRMEMDDLATLAGPSIVFWAFQHFMVLEGIKERFGRRWVHVNDPATGPRRMEYDEFDGGYTGIVLEFRPTAEFVPGGRRTPLWRGLRDRWNGSGGGLLALAVLASMLLVVPGVVAPAFTRIFVDSVLGGGDSRLGGLLLAMVLAAVTMFVLTEIQQRSFITLYTKLTVTTAPTFFRHLLSLPVEFFLQRQPAELARRVRSNTVIADLLSREIATTAVSLVLVVVYAAVMLSYDLALSVLAVLTASANVLVLRWVSRLRTDAVARLRADRGKLMSTSISTLRVIETIKASGTEPQSFARWAGFQAKVANLEQRLGVPTILLTAAPPALATFNSGLVLLVGGLKAITGAVSIGLLVAFQALLASMARPVTQLTNLGERLQDVTADVDRIGDVLAQPRDPDLSRTADDTGALLSGEVVMDRVTFGYGPLADPVLREVSLRLSPGRRVAVVGDSGSGKSTVGRLVAGTYQPRSGTILFDGHPRTHYPRLTLANSVAVVEQDVYLFQGSVRDNVTLWDDSVPSDAVVAALRDAEIYESMARRPGGVQSQVAEAGRNLSGGQRQRLALARALVRNPSVLVLDEATSALDGETERRVDDNLRRRGIACLIIAHRLSTIRDADEIIVLRQGRVVERGTHRDLMARRAEYHRLVTSS